MCERLLGDAEMCLDGFSFFFGGGETCLTQSYAKPCAQPINKLRTIVFCFMVHRPMDFDIGSDLETSEIHVYIYIYIYTCQ